MTADGAPSVAARDDLAGVVDLFGWLTRAELSRALSELAFKRRASVDAAAIAAAIDVAVAEYALVPAPPAALSEAGKTPETVASPPGGRSDGAAGDAAADNDAAGDAAADNDAAGDAAADNDAAGDAAADNDTADNDTTDPDATRDDIALAVGPAAFPSLSADAEDLPHILDVPERSVDREKLAAAVLDRLSADAVAAIGEGDTERLETLADVTYDIEAWAPVDAGDIRDRIVDEADS